MLGGYFPIGPGSGSGSGGGGGGSPGGSNGDLQYNNSGSFGGVANYTSDGTNLFTGLDIQGGPYEVETFIVLATGNITFYVDPTGSDSNNGSSAHPYATIQHALNVAALFDYLNLYIPTIQINAGTYTLTSSIYLPSIRNPGGNPTILGTTPATNVVINAQATPNFVAFIPDGSAEQYWQGGGYEIDVAGGAYLINPGAGFIIHGEHVFQDSVGGGTNMGPFTLNGPGAYMLWHSGTLTVLPSSLAGWIFCESGRFDDENNSGIVLPATLSNGAAWITANDFSNISFFPLSITNSGGVSGQTADIENNASLFTNNNIESDIPGTANSIFGDGTSDFGGRIFVVTTQGGGAPTTTDIPQTGTYGVFTNGSGSFWIAANNAGTIVKAQLT